MRDAIAMLTRCYRHQHPEEFGGAAIPEEFPVATRAPSWEATPPTSPEYLPVESWTA